MEDRTRLEDQILDKSKAIAALKMALHDKNHASHAVPPSKPELAIISSSEAHTALQRQVIEQSVQLHQLQQVLEARKLASETIRLETRKLLDDARALCESNNVRTQQLNYLSDELNEKRAAHEANIAQLQDLRRTIEELSNIIHTRETREQDSQDDIKSLRRVVLDLLSDRSKLADELSMARIHSMQLIESQSKRRLDALQQYEECQQRDEQRQSVLALSETKVVELMCQCETLQKRVIELQGEQMRVQSSKTIDAKRHVARESELKAVTSELAAAISEREELAHANVLLRQQVKSLSAIHSQEEAALKAQIKSASEKPAKLLVALSGAIPHFTTAIDRLPKQLKQDASQLLDEFLRPDASRLQFEAVAESSLPRAAGILPAFPSKKRNDKKPVAQVESTVEYESSPPVETAKRKRHQKTQSVIDSDDD